MNRVDVGCWMLDFGLPSASCAARARNPKSKIQNPQSGFTLIEVLIAIALITVLVGSMFGFLFDMLSSRARASEVMQQQQAASVLVRRLDGDLMTCIVGDRASGAGLYGDETHMRVLMRGVMSKYAERGVDDPDAFGDLQIAEYRFNPSSQRIEGRRMAANVGATLAASEALEPIAGTIYKLRFRYHDGQQWQSRFDSLAARRLPVAIELALWTNPLPDEAARDAVFDAATQPTTRAVLDESSPKNGEDDEVPPPDRVRVFMIPDAAAEEENHE